MDDDQLAAVGALADPQRRALYRLVARADAAVSRDQAAAALGVPRHVARFHLERLVAEGLLETEHRRLSGRRGPGAGRPATLYRRAARQFAVSLPERRYDLAASVLAAAVDGGVPVPVAAAAEGRRRARPGVPLADVLTDLGYEPHPAGSAVVLANCPFADLAAEHPALVCGLNGALLTGVLEERGEQARAVPDPAPGRCCVVLRAP